MTRQPVLSILLIVVAASVSMGQSVDEKWQENINDNRPDIDQHYTDDPVLITGSGRIFDGQHDLMGYVEDLRSRVSTIKSIQKIKNVEFADNLSYEIGAISAGNGSFNYLIIRNTESDQDRRELEVIISSDDEEIDLQSLDQARERWMALCNAHNAYELVNLMYTDNAIYYNHKPVIRGTTAIAAEYSYMNRPQYNLQLSPLHVEPVNGSNVFEIGQCSGSYGGNYVLWWTKDQDGEWQVLMDTNK